MAPTNVIDVIRNFDFDALRGQLRESPEPTDGRTLDEVIETTAEWLEAVQSDLVALVSEIDGGDDMEMVLAIQYVELKSRWIAFNTKMNYTLFKGNQPVVNDLFRASAVSALLGHIESLLREEDIEHITTFLGQPIANAA
ncbi:MAG: hypothetical protein AAFR76_11410 [Planctomycetota bacterium]